MSALRAWRRKLSTTPTSFSQLTTPISKLRNLIIIAHIDSGKSTLSDRFLQVTGTVSETELRERSQFLDSSPVERERQITIKARAARMQWRDHAITLIDCPGHHDFSRQVSRSARAVEGALLLVDATRGVQAQTLSSVELAMEAGLDTFVPVINKIDLPTADISRAREQIEHFVGLDGNDAVLTSAKSGIGVEDALDAIIQRMSAPAGMNESPLQALIFDSYFDTYRGVVLFVRIVNGILRKGDSIISMSNIQNTNAVTDPLLVDGIGFLQPHEVAQTELHPGDIGYITAAIRRVGDVPVGDTITHAAPTLTAESALPGYEESKPLVFCGLFPTANGDFATLRSALDRLQLQDGSVWYEPEKSCALGSGFRCGFLGLLHMAVTQERLEQEFGLDLIASTPSVSYNVLPEGSEDWIMVSNPGEVPEGRVKFEEPIARVDIICQQDQVGSMMELAMGRRGEIEDQKSLGLDRVKLVFKLPLAEIVTDFHDQMKSRSGGFGSMHYEVIGLRKSDLVKLDIHVAGTVVDGLSCVIHRDVVESEGRGIVDRLKLAIPRQMFKIAIQAVVGSKIVASAQIQPFRKDVTAKCYGGDSSRKKKLLKKQAEGKKRMKTVGKVTIPQDAFLTIMRLDK